jgi:TolB-like protein
MGSFRFLTPWAFAASLVAAPVTHADSGKSVAVFPMTAEQGVAPSAARLLTEEVIHTARTSNAFASVVSTVEIENVMGLERQRQLLDCQTGSCVAEVAGSLGVDYLLLASVGRLGAVLVLSVRLVDAHNGKLLASVSQKVCSGGEEGALRAVAPSVRQVLASGGLVNSGGGTFDGGCGNADSPPAERPAWFIPAVASGGTLAGVGAAMLAAAVAGLLGTAGSIAIPRLVFVSTTWLGVGPGNRDNFFNSVSVGAGVLAGLLAVVAVGMMTVGAGTVAAAWLGSGR